MAQDVSFLLKEAEQFELQKKEEKALAKYQEALRISPTDLKALCKISQWNSILGNRKVEKKTKQEYFTAAFMYAERAVASNAQSAEANFVMGLAKAKLSEISSPKEKIKFVKEIRNSAEKALEADSLHYPSLHLLGKWHFEVSTLGGMEKAAIKLMGGLPTSSLSDAIFLFEKVRRIKPSFVLNYLDLAKAYKEQGRSDKAVEILQRLVRMAPKSIDDEVYKEEGKKLLESLL
jgi:tetratricopeptide (TPR) repeat protein